MIRLRQRHKRMNERGMTLIELLAAASISVIVLGAAVSIVYSLYTTYHKSTEDFGIKSETNLILNAILSGAANATEVVVDTGAITFKDDPTWYKFTLTTIPSSSLKQLTYQKIVGSQIDTFILSQQIESLKLKWGTAMVMTDLSNIPGKSTIYGTDLANSLIPIEFTLQNGSRSETVKLNVNLLRTSKPTLPP
jgi:prepilin-type N-terminal cleavage/methylation domain-containing protein